MECDLVHPTKDDSRHEDRRPDNQVGRLSTPRTAWLFDVDGVLTEPELKAITQPALLDELIRRLQLDEPVGLNSGRSLHFLDERVLRPLEQRIVDRSILRGLTALGEKGGARITYTAGGVQIAYVDERISVPSELQHDVRRLVQRQEFSGVMFYDETKRTMLSVELRAGTSQADFSARQPLLLAELKQLLAKHGLSGDFRVDPTRIATDVEHTLFGKAYGASQFVELLDAAGIHPKRYVCFGDSISDYDMLDELLRLGKQVRFVFVGERDLLSGKNLRYVSFPHDPFDQGTLNYLQSH